MKPEQMQMSDGYVGSMGISWKTPTQDDIEKAIVGAMKIEGRSHDEIVSMLEAGMTVRWCESPNYHYDHSYGKIGIKRTSKPVEMVMCDCGHEISRTNIMNASLGTSCPDCYDRMSD